MVTGVPADVACRRPLANVFAAWDVLAAEIPVSEGDAPARAVTMPTDVGGRELWLSFVAVRMGEGIVYAFRDLTLERKLEEAKSDFIATISHELRTPMTAVLGAATTLLRSDLELPPDQARELLRMIATQATRLSQVTEEVLLASRLDRGELRVEATSVDVDRVVRETLATVQPQLADGLAVELRAGDAGEALGDPDRVQQVLLNLLDNAAKYSPGGGTIVVSTKRVDGSVRVSVADEGIGIPPAEQERIFEKFYRVDPNLTQSPAGTGLGLYICRELVERMGGRMEVRSRLGEGSTFAFDLPAR
jgi:signal transduction histidine kinase